MTTMGADPPVRPIKKIATGIAGFDEITGGGLPEGRITALVGGTGVGKTVFALQTLVSRSTHHGAPGIFVTFEESIDRIRCNMASFDWPGLDEGRLRFIDARPRADVVVAGTFDLTGLLARLGVLVAETGAREVVFDGIDMLLSALADERLERQELTRLDEWVRASGVSAMITVKAAGLTARDDLRATYMQYITDCVVALEDAQSPTTSSRRLRILKYRGSDFQANPAPVVIHGSGLNVLTFKRVRGDYPTFSERISSGIPRLDASLDGGYIRGSNILVSGSPGTSKTSLAASFAAAACATGKKALFVSFDESGSQIIANMKSIGLDLQPHVSSALLSFQSLISSARSPEDNFLAICDLMDLMAPEVMIIDPLSSLLKDDFQFSRIICESLVDRAKARGITLFCSLLLEQVTGDQEFSPNNAWTVADTSIHLSYVARDGERNRALTIIKSRGAAHSNQVRELLLGRAGVNLVDAYVAEGEVLMGSARAQREADLRRRQAENEGNADRAKLQSSHEIEDLKGRLAALALELSWREKEARQIGDTEDGVVTRDRQDARARLDMRRSQNERTEP